MRQRVGDKRVLVVVKAILHAGVLREDGVMRYSTTGTPQGGILSPLLANIAFSVLDEHFAEAWQANSAYQRTKRRRNGLANYRQAWRASAARAWIGLIPRARYSASRLANTGECTARPYTIPISAARYSANPRREIRPRRLMMAE